MGLGKGGLEKRWVMRRVSCVKGGLRKELVKERVG